MELFDIIVCDEIDFILWIYLIYQKVSFGRLSISILRSEIQLPECR